MWQRIGGGRKRAAGAEGMGRNAGTARRWRLIVAVAAAVAIIAVSAGSGHATPITVAFRYDDYSALSHTELETRLIDALRHYGVPATFGVIPYRCAGDIHDPLPQDLVALTPEKAEVLQESIDAGIVEVALHGYSHQTSRRPEDGGYAEFSGLDYETAAERIEAGRALLGRLLRSPITTFIPPWNAYDLTTLEVVEDLRLTLLSADPRGPATRRSGLNFLPATTNVPGLQDAVDGARSLTEGTAVIVVLLHDYDFVEVNQERGRFTYGDLLRQLSWIASQEDVQVCSLREATQLLGDLDADRYIGFSKYGAGGSVWDLLPPWLRSAPSGVYLGSASCARLKVRAWTLLVGLCVTLLLVSGSIAFVVASALCSRWPGGIAVCLYGGAALVVLLSIYAVRDLNISHRGVEAIGAALGAYVGMSVAFVRRRRGVG